MLSCNISVLKISSRLRVTYKTKNRTTLWTVQPTFPISQWKQKTERKEKVAQLSIFVSNFNYNGRLAFTKEDVRSCTSSTFFRDDQRAFQAQHVARTLLHREERGAPFGISVAKRPASSFVNRVARTGIWTRIPASHVATPTVIDKARSINETNSRRVTPTRIMRDKDRKLGKPRSSRVLVNSTMTKRTVFLASKKIFKFQFGNVKFEESEKTRKLFIIRNLAF